MPPGVEDGESVSQYVPPPAVPRAAIDGGTPTLLLGSSTGEWAGDAQPDHIAPEHELPGRATWKQAHSGLYLPPPSHDLAWACVFEGVASGCRRHDVA